VGLTTIRPGAAAGRTRGTTIDRPDPVGFDSGAGRQPGKTPRAGCLSWLPLFKSALYRLRPVSRTPSL